MDQTLALASLLGTIRNLYPQARVTSGYRGPNNPLTLRNPASLHAQGSMSDPRAVDVAPIPGVKFQDYVSSVRNAGIPIAQAFDEASHPFSWTTGPNWHLATGNPQVAAAPQRKPRTLADLSQTYSQPSPVGIMAQPQVGDAPGMSLPPIMPMDGPPKTLADLQMPTVAPKSHKTEHTLGNIAGILGDALMAYSGMQPQFGPALRKQQEDDQQMAFDREKLNQELQIAREKALEPPAAIQDYQWFNGQPAPVQRQYLQYQDATNPIRVATPQGTQAVSRTETRQIGGKNYYRIGSDWYEETN